MPEDVLTDVEPLRVYTDVDGLVYDAILNQTDISHNVSGLNPDFRC